ncbi:hypothetical protein HXX76_012580 [Chlamydomonas incerta]|uniref:Uncharacterized protein n=1 Tax=Chlamydomonas incerta TaxID=51695 RepID=A0A835SK77_CHLIN|nr:hypothetical protein HXX76_012580 [Chlamydomonas incerta]|eukprot:KAG2427066.1 hypothetical protein HXX76_012580 [Chlamydomonas incerta]
MALLPAGVTPDEAALEDVEFAAPEVVELVDGGTYLVTQPMSIGLEQVDNLQAWQDSYIKAEEATGVQHALTRMKEAGYSDAKVLCVKNLRNEGQIVEVDGIVTAKGAVMIVENKTKLTSKSASSLVNKLKTIKTMMDEVEPSSSLPVAKLKGKPLMAVLCGRIVTSDTTDVNKLAAICKEHKIEVWLVNGSGVELSSGCFKSPYVHPLGKHHNGSTTSATAVAVHKAAATCAGAAGSSAVCHLRHSSVLLQLPITSRGSGSGRVKLSGQQLPRLHLF